MFQSEHDRRKGVAILQTALFCIVLEAVVLLVLTGITGSFVAAVAVSVIFLGPLSLWAAPALYAHILKASE